MHIATAVAVKVSTTVATSMQLARDQAQTQHDNTACKHAEQRCHFHLSVLQYVVFDCSVKTSTDVLNSMTHGEIRCVTALRMKVQTLLQSASVWICHKVRIWNRDVRVVSLSVKDVRI